MASIEIQLRKYFNLFIKGCFVCLFFFFPCTAKSEIATTLSYGNCDSDSCREYKELQPQDSARCFLSGFLLFCPFGDFLMDSEKVFIEGRQKSLLANQFSLLCSIGR